MHTTLWPGDLNVRNKLGRRRHRLDSNVKADFKAAGLGGANWIQIAQDTNQWWTQFLDFETDVTYTVLYRCSWALLSNIVITHFSNIAWNFFFC